MWPIRMVEHSEGVERFCEVRICTFFKAEIVFFKETQYFSLYTRSAHSGSKMLTTEDKELLKYMNNLKVK